MTNPIPIADRRQLFVDNHLIDSLTGEAGLDVQRPEPRELVLETGEPWEGNTSAYYALFEDHDRLRLYYRGSHYDEADGHHRDREFVCYAESRDGINWEKPALDLVDFGGSRKNNIVWAGTGTHNFTPFLDQNPNGPRGLRYRALGRGMGSETPGLYAFHSVDGLHWSKTVAEPIITRGAFDSQNLAFWDPYQGQYICYYRAFRDGVRDIMVTTSTDFLHWTEPQFLDYSGAEDEHLYTNAILRYPRAPHYLIGFPTRFYPDTQQTEPLFMASRDGRRFTRWSDPVIPFSDDPERNGNRSNYMAWGLLRLPGDAEVYSVYATESYYRGASTRLRRFAYRLDGFVALNAAGRGAMITRPVIFKGDEMELNFKTAAGGYVTVELLDTTGQPLPGFGCAECRPLRGDATAQSVRWFSDKSMGALAGRPVRLKIELEDAALFSFRFKTSS